MIITWRTKQIKWLNIISLLLLIGGFKYVWVLIKKVPSTFYKKNHY